jgi:Zn-dependent peptidase ImmA (M78 family)
MSVIAARNQAENLVKVSGFTSPVIDVEAIAKKMGVHVIRVELDQTISGLLFTHPETNSSCIAIQKGDDETRQRFSIAHELGHFCLKHQFKPGDHVHVDHGFLISQRGPMAASGTNAIEREANNFAGSLLMPHAMIIASVGRRRVEQKNDQLYDRDITHLAKEYNVSEQAMMVRLNILRIL